MLINNRNLALCALIQAVELVDELARFGRCNDGAYEVLIGSLFNHSADDPQMIYGPNSNLSYGAAALIDVLGDRKTSKQNIIMYSLGVVALDKKLRANKTFMGLIDQRLPDIQRQINMYGLTHPTIYASISDLYQSTVSQLGFRIQVVGDVNYLSQSNVADKIRALLFAGIRAAALWRQLGGRKYQLLFGKSKLKAQLATLT